MKEEMRRRERKREEKVLFVKSGFSSPRQKG